MKENQMMDINLKIFQVEVIVDKIGIIFFSRTDWIFYFSMI